MTLEQYLDRWQSVHGGHDPRANPMVRHWLSLVLRLARPVARTGVHPDVVTLASLLVAAVVLAVPPSAGALLVLASGLLDGVDGCVAALQDRVTQLGYRLATWRAPYQHYDPAASLGALVWSAPG